MSDTLLLADDNATMQRVVELTFAEQGLKVVSVSDGEQAIDYITRQRPALALVSATLHKVNGFDVARYVRDHVDGRVPVLLVAGAFDNLDEAQVRAAGASGVLVKPFEPSVVIKRVKELLGMKSDPAQVSTASEPATASGRLLTTSDGPPRAPQSAAAATDAASTPRALEPAVPSADVPGTGGDYLAHLDAAFDSLDAQLRSGPSSRAAEATATGEPAAQGYAGGPPPPLGFRETTEGEAKDPKSAFAVASDSFGAVSELIVTRAVDHLSPQTAPPPAAEDRSWLPSTLLDSASSAPAAETIESNAVRTSAPGAPAAPGESSAPVAPRESNGAAASGGSHAPAASTAPGATQATQAPAAASSPNPVDPRAGTSGLGAPSATSSTPADAFAMLWAQEQGEPLPAPAPMAPVELNQKTVDALTSQLTARVAAQVGAPLADRLGDDLGGRLITGIAARITGDMADRLTVQLPGPLVAGLSERIGAGLSERVASDLAARLSDDLARRLGEELGPRLVNELVARLGPPVLERLTAQLAERLTGPLGDRLAPGLDGRVAEIVAERTLQSALGDSLRQTVHDVAERVVRAEIERIKTAAATHRS